MRIRVKDALGRGQELYVRVTGANLQLQRVSHALSAQTFSLQRLRDA